MGSELRQHLIKAPTTDQGRSMALIAPHQLGGKRDSTSIEKKNNEPAWIATHPPTLQAAVADGKEILEIDSLKPQDYDYTEQP